MKDKFFLFAIRIVESGPGQFTILGRALQCRRVLLCGSIPNNDPEVHKAVDKVEARFRSEARKAGRSHLVAPATAPDAPLCGTMPWRGIRRDDFGHLISLNVRVVMRSHSERCVFFFDFCLFLVFYGESDLVVLSFVFSHHSCLTDSSVSQACLSLLMALRQRVRQG